MNRLLLATTVLACAATAGHAAALRKQLQVARRLALTDTLTGLLNRSGLRAKFEELVVATDVNSLIGAMLVDLDGFKKLNDAHGHDVGDQVLIRVAHRLVRLRLDGRLGIVARLGGDEFAVLGASRFPEELQAFPQAVMASVEHPIRFDSLTLRPRASVGMAHARASAADLGELLAKADAAMYRAKRRGGGTGRYLESIDGPALRVSRPPVRTRDSHSTSTITSEVIPSP